MKRLLILQLSAVLDTVSSLPSTHSARSQTTSPKCRFATEWSQEDVLGDPKGFERELLLWEGKFHQNDVAYNTANGMTYDGTQLNWTTGLASKKHPFSAASKEALQFMLYSHAIAGSREAAQFLVPGNPSSAPQFAAAILDTKLQTYLKFNQTNPGFGGFIPWVTTSETELTPTWDWNNRVPALDNRELVWAVYGCVHVLEKSGIKPFKDLARGWQKWLNYVKTTAAQVFHRGSGRVCAVTKLLNQTLPPDDPLQSYECEGAGLLDDPYEGELFTHWLSLFGGLSREEKDALWKAKRPKLRNVEYKMGGVGPITVEEGYWFSSHELWKVLELPYYDVKIVKRLYHNAERARTCNAAITKAPGLFASVNNSTNPDTDEIMGYISPAGIPSIASQKQQEHDVITPYATWPTMMFDKAVGLAWWHNMVVAKKMQNPYGSTESTRVDGKLVSAMITWDSKVLTVLALLGGASDFVRPKMKQDGIYREFISITENEYSRVFKELKGENVKLCLPKRVVPHAGLKDFTHCSA